MGNHPKKFVFVSIPTEEHAERLKLEGVLAYAHDKKGSRWNIQLDPGGLIEHIAKHPRHFGIDGIIAYVENNQMRQTLAKSSCPCVLIEDLLLPAAPASGRHLVTLVCDHFEEGRRAAAYFLARHFKNFAWVGPTVRNQWASQRLSGFKSVLRENGIACHCYPAPRGDAAYNFALELPSLSGWIQSLPRPCALFACRDSRARQVIIAADEMGIPIPEGLAILGVDNDEIICTTTNPSLSSVCTSDHTIGYAAGRALNKLISENAPGCVIRSNHTHIITRLSTDTEAVSDPLVAKALQYAREHLAEDLDAEKLAQKIHYPRHALQTRAERSLGITLGREIRRIRLAAATTMLVSSNVGVEEIARRCGFSGTSHLSLRMKEAYNTTPLAYRKRYTPQSGNPREFPIG